ncbi:MAG TPA: polysaccharide deacetylase family protein [Chitinophagaceae bacterium]|nr:polysaccharide deacetylase family protein [Chitinophagaceae bacterium]
MTKVPSIIKKFFSNFVWDIPTKENILYLTFDDGPHPEATPFALEELKKYNAKATFFCVGNNVVNHPDIYRQIIEEGHVTGNHTFQHLNGWKVSDKKYFDDVVEARKYIDSILFRPPYGKITRFQSRHLRDSSLGFRIIMWDVLSKDYDVKLKGEDCAFNVLRYSKPGSIVVFHDSAKAFPRMKEALVTTLKFFSEKGYRFEAIRLV